MAKGIAFNDADDLKDELLNKNKKKIKSFYNEVKKDLQKQLSSLSKNESISGRLKRVQLKGLIGQVENAYSKVDSDVEKTIDDSLHGVVKGVYKDQGKWLKGHLGNKVKLNVDAFGKLEDEVVQRVLTGKIYKNNWKYSKSIWGNSKKASDDINQIVAKGLAENKSSYEIAKELEKYVNPNAAKPWDWGKVYPGSGKVIDYNAQRLARTLTNHAYQEAVIRSTKKNPFAKGVKWETTNSHTGPCEVCRQRATQDHYGLGPGVFPVDKVPLDHPNGKCTLTVVLIKDEDEIDDMLVNWVNSPEGTYPQIDDYVKSIGYDVSKFVTKPTSKAFKSANGDPDAIDKWTRRSSQFEYAIEDVINFQGFDGLPRVVDDDEFEKAAKKSNFIAQRAYGAETKETLDSYREQLYNGKWYVDCSKGGSIYGKGMYGVFDHGFKVTDGMTHQLQTYMKNKENYVETFTLASDAKKVYLSELKEISEQKRKELLKYARKSGGSEEAMRKVDDLGEALDDYGQLATLLGYDAVIIDEPGQTYAIFLNRTKIIFKRSK